jgi:RpiR family carbohydrate utilization transcriptional regulator|tara:strand:- start:2163 stop:3017 length:855 start_codon:yes stop_codon:yes gene_type:complete
MSHSEEEKLRFKILNMLPTLNQSEGKVARLVLDYPDEIVNFSISQTAAQAGVSGTTVNRFCRRLMLNGYPDLKIQIAKNLGSGIQYVSSAVTLGDSDETYPLKIFGSAIEQMIIARDSLPIIEIAKAVEIFQNAKQIFFIGFGTSAAVATDAEHRFFRFGVPVAATLDPLVADMQAAGSDKDTVFVYISNTGRTKLLLNNSEIAKKSNAKIVGFTKRGSPLAEVCDVVLDTKAIEDTEAYLPMTSRLVHLALLDVLATGFIIKAGSDTQNRLRILRNTLNKTRV